MNFIESLITAIFIVGILALILWVGFTILPQLSEEWLYIIAAVVFIIAIVCILYEPD